MNLHLTPVWPRPPICDVTVPYVPPPAAPSTSLTPTRRDGLKTVCTDLEHERDQGSE